MEPGNGTIRPDTLIDYIMSSDKRVVMNVKVIPGHSLDSDHRLFIGDLRIRRIQHQATEKKDQRSEAGYSKGKI